MSSQQEKTNRKSFINELPDIFWAAAILAGVTVCLLIWFSISPSFTVALDKPIGGVAHAASQDAVLSKPSPFTPVVDESRVLVRRAAAKLRPAAVSLIETPDSYGAATENGSEPPIGADVLKTVYTHEPADPAARPLNTAERTPAQTKQYYRGEQMYRAIETNYDMPRTTATNYAPAGAPAHRIDSSRAVRPAVSVSSDAVLAR
jgi:hypothetical protein